MKKCIKCHEIKPRTKEHFYVNKRMKDGLINTCKPCDIKDTIRRQKIRGPEYKAWQGMKERCYNQNREDYKNYGNRGIKMCDEWLNDYDSFLKHVGRRPSDKYSIDRIDNNGNYEPGNVKWSTRSEQAINRNKKRSNRTGRNGVAWRKDYKSWRVELGFQGRRINIGNFKSYDDALKAREQAEIKYYGRIIEQ